MSFFSMKGFDAPYRPSVYQNG